MIRVLLVWLGNICRSPSAEAVLRHMAPGLTLDSAGTGNWHAGDPPYPPMQAAAKARGYTMSDLRARQVRPDDFTTFDLILAMDSQNLADLQSLRPGGSNATLELFLNAIPEHGPDVPDPYYTRDFYGALDIIEAASSAWAARLTTRP